MTDPQESNPPSPVDPPAQPLSRADPFRRTASVLAPDSVRRARPTLDGTVPSRDWRTLLAIAGSALVIVAFFFVPAESSAGGTFSVTELVDASKLLADISDEDALDATQLWYLVPVAAGVLLMIQVVEYMAVTASDGRRKLVRLVVGGAYFALVAGWLGVGVAIDEVGDCLLRPLLGFFENEWTGRNPAFPLMAIGLGLAALPPLGVKTGQRH